MYRYVAIQDQELSPANDRRGGGAAGLTARVPY